MAMCDGCYQIYADGFYCQCLLMFCPSCRYSQKSCLCSRLTTEDKKLIKNYKNRKYSAKYYERNRGRNRERNRKYREMNQEKNREKIREKNRIRYRKNKKLLFVYRNGHF